MRAKFVWCFVGLSGNFRVFRLGVGLWGCAGEGGVDSVRGPLPVISLGRYAIGRRGMYCTFAGVSDVVIREGAKFNGICCALACSIGLYFWLLFHWSVGGEWGGGRG